MSSRRWDFFETAEGTMEPWMINRPRPRQNPPLVVAFNRPQKGRDTMGRVISMRRNRKGQFVAGGRSHNPKRRKKTTHHRKNYMGAGAVLPMFNPKRKNYRRNQPAAIAGFPVAIPEIGTIAAVLGGIVGPSTIQTIAAGFASQQGTAQISPTMRTVIKGLSYVIPPAVGYYVGGRAVMKNVIAGEIAAAVAGQVASMIGSALSGAGLSGYTRGPQQRMLGGYTAPRLQLTGGNWANRSGTPMPSNMNAARFKSRYHN